MYPDSLISVTQTEEKLRQDKADAAVQGKKRVAEAKADGEALIARSIKKAEAEVNARADALEEAFREKAGDRAASLENKKAVMRAKAESRMDKAVAFISERIVIG